VAVLYSLIAGAWADERVMKEGKPDFPAIDPLFPIMPDNRYWTLGKYAGDAWNAGKNFKTAITHIPRKDSTINGNHTR
jgi:hypothetical protein